VPRDEPPAFSAEPIVQLRRQVRKSKPAQPQGEAAAPLSDTEDEAAVAFSNRHAEELRYVNAWHKWLRWSSHSHWRIIETLWVFHQVRIVAREFANFYEDKKLGKDAATAAIERSARNDPRHDAAAEAWDTGDDIFNNPDREASR
jgi:putative DNA primase/helicase